MLGGEGNPGDLTRDLTEIEEQILEGIVRIICRDLQTSWQAIHLEFAFGACQKVSQAQRLMPPDEKNLCLSFEIRLAESRGTLNLAVPALVSNALLRKISVDSSYQRPHTSIESRSQIQQKMLDCLFSMELVMPDLEVPLDNLSALVPGAILPFRQSASTPAVLEIGGVPLCSAVPVRVDLRRAARVVALETETNSPAGAP
jgi:flagellar motor switch protein FliM